MRARPTLPLLLLAGCFFGAQLTGESASDRYGFVVAPMGDLDWDTYADFAVGAPYADGAGTNRGKAYVYEGDPSIATTAPSVSDAAVFVGATDNERAGWSMASGDFDSDGYIDLAIGAPYKRDANNAVTGAVYLIHGEHVLDAMGDTFELANADCVIYGLSSGDTFGWSLAAGNLGGTNDSLAVGAPLNASGVGMLYVFSEVDWTSCPTLSDSEQIRDTAAGNLGYALAVVENWDGSGENALLAGAPKRNSSRGRAFLYAASSIAGGTADRTWVGAAAGDRFGAAVTGVDTDADGADGVALGAPTADNGSTSNVGKVYVLSEATNASGMVSAASVAESVLIGEIADGQLGYSVAGGNISSATVGECVFAGAPYSNISASSGGALHGACPDTLPSYASPGAVSVNGGSSTTASARYGWSVAVIGDVIGSAENAGMVSAPWTSSGDVYLLGLD